MISWKKRREKPGWLVCIDPGGVTGWAVFHNGVLVACGYGPFEKVLKLDMVPKRVRKGTLLIEIPVAYPNKKSKADPNDLIRTSLRAGEFRHKFRLRGFDIEEIAPNQWKGTIPKPEKVSEPYVITERVVDRMSPEEMELLYASKSARATTFDWNMIDALGMGCWRLRRKIR